VLWFVREWYGCIDYHCDLCCEVHYVHKWTITHNERTHPRQRINQGNPQERGDEPEEGSWWKFCGCEKGHFERFTTGEWCRDGTCGPYTSKFPHSDLCWCFDCGAYGGGYQLRKLKKRTKYRCEACNRRRTELRACASGIRKLTQEGKK
jgi:hypothetical protein